jgi:hypothetical protein
MNQPPDNAPTGTVIDTLRQHTRRTAQLLGCLDDLRSGATTALGGTDLTTLVAHFSERLRAGDGQLQQLVHRLETVPPSVPFRSSRSSTPETPKTPKT